MSNPSLESLKIHIDQETDPELKKLYSMMYGSLLYMEYVHNVDLELHRRAVAYLSDTHGLSGISFD